MSQSTDWDAAGTWSISSGGYNLTGSYTDQSGQQQSTSNRSTQTFDPQTDQWNSENRNSHSNSSLIDRLSSGSGSYSHDRFGYDVSGTASTLNSYRHETLVAVTQIYVNGVRSADSHGEQFTDTQTRNRTSFSGAGGDDRIVVVNQPQYNGNGQNIGDRQTTTTYAHSTSEQMLRDLQHSDRSEYIYDAASGTMKLNHRTIIDQQEINNDLDVVHDVRTETELETADTIQMIIQGITLTGVQTSHESESDYRNRTRFHTTQTLNQTTTNVAYHWGENAGQASLVRTGAPLATSFRYETLSSSDGESKSVATHPSYNYSTTQTSKGTMATVDRVDTIHLLDGSHSSTYQGNRTLNGPGERHTYESEIFGQTESGVYEIPVEMSFGVDPGSYNLTIASSDDPEGSSGDLPPEPYQYPSSYLAVSSIVTAVGGFAMPGLTPYFAGVSMLIQDSGWLLSGATGAVGQLFDALPQQLDSDTPSGEPGDPDLGDPDPAGDETSAAGAAAAAQYTDQLVAFDFIAAVPSPPGMAALETEAEAEITLMSQPTPPIEPDPDPESPKQGIIRSFVNRIFGYTEADRLAALEREAEADARRAAAQAERERIGVRGAAAGLGANVYGSERQMEASAAAPALQSTLASMATLGVSDAISGVIGEDIATETELTVPERVVAVVPVAATPFGRILDKLPIVGRLFGKAADAPNSGPAFKTWNQFQSGTAGQFASRAEAAAAWNAYKQANEIVTGTTRSAAARSNFLKGLADDANTPSWMKQWLSQGKTPPGYDVDHILPLSVGGLDDAANMRLQLRELHKLHHQFYRPWE